MNMAISDTPVRGHGPHVRPANFGQLNSAIARGDLTSAQAAFTAINESTAPAAIAAKAKGSLEAVGKAIASGDLDAARKSLADLRTGRSSRFEAATANERTNALDPTLARETLPTFSEPPASAQQILAVLTGSGSTVSTFA